MPIPKMNFSWLKRRPFTNQPTSYIEIRHIHTLNTADLILICFFAYACATMWGTDAAKIHDARMRSFTMDYAAEEGSSDDG